MADIKSNAGRRKANPLTEQSKNRTPRIALTVGDPAGIGPEICLKAAENPDLSSLCRLAIVGDASELKRQASVFGLDCNYPVIVADSTSIDWHDSSVVIVNTGSLESPATPGVLSADCGRAAVAFIEKAVQLALQGEVDAITTAPINKEAIKLAGSPFPGHTEMLAALCGSDRWLMSFSAGKLVVILLTIHLSLADAIAAINHQDVASTITLADSELRRFGLEKPRIAVCGLNPHAGEHGLFGTEEQREIIPAVEECRAKGLNVSGPFPADTLFGRAFRGEFDAVIACYHDQGLIPVKCMAFGNSAGTTLGLPIIRTSVDHGTAFDIAGRGIADESSLIEAIRLAVNLSNAERETAENGFRDDETRSTTGTLSH